MDNREQQSRERAYKLWEDEGRPKGAHDDHWERAEDQHALVEQQSDDVTKVNQEADDKFAKDDRVSENAADIKPPSAVSPD
ncbi:DUF2934 domain-containing protein [Rhizobiales bacterium RZME27]|uniref:DUF2934 domain-containing protein n=1 Tax=Endobacterium cereale TaxID=2663029 RepID=A0A6A8A5H6_9HYPH|nr:DUF2934 domain-containing protein [Endobacterium cereale]MEB2846766.1 DUF2934 domain-containing protein [Endobacterium cereale]MQY46515.1 DUF2934 domain-containing protein [Endobacterium cereale]